MVKRSVAVTRGSLSHLIVPQSKSCVSTSAGLMNRRPASLDMLVPFAAFRVDVEVLETLHLLSDGTLRGQPLDARGAKESANPSGSAEDVLNVLRLGDRAAMAEDQNFRMDGDGCLLDSLNAGNRLIECDRGPGADGPFGG
jgi:hypothetical protein